MERSLAVTRPAVIPSAPIVDALALWIIWLFYGGSGVAKSTAAQLAPRVFPLLALALWKISTRPRRPSDQAGSCDVVPVSTAAFDRLSAAGDLYQYQYGGFWYGLQRSVLAEGLRRFRNVTAVIGSVEVIKQVRRDFPNARVIAVALTVRPDLTTARLRAAGCTAEEITTRLSRSQQVLDEYAAHPDAFDYVIENNGTKADLERQVLSLFANYNNIQTPALEVAA